jgi:hypothetical protein
MSSKGGGRKHEATPTNDGPWNGSSCPSYASRRPWKGFMRAIGLPEGPEGLEALQWGLVASLHPGRIRPSRRQDRCHLILSRPSIKQWG